MQQSSSEPEPAQTNWALAALFAIVLPFLIGGIALIYASGMTKAFEIPQWFDPLFFQYNLLLWMLFVLLIPIITYFYVQSMKQERTTRLHDELERETWLEREQYIGQVIQRQFGMKNYIGSTMTLMVVTATGLAVLLLLKPLPGHGAGLDYGRGANMFLMAGYIVLDPVTDSAAYFDRVVTSLTAFQFAFLGAYIYFIQHLVRSYFTMDLTPNTFVAMSIRMVTAGVVALVVSFALPNLLGVDTAAEKDRLRGLLPVVSFGIGYFPDWGLLVITKLARRALMLGRGGKSSSMPLSDLSGMSDEHEVRLRRQGYDSIENIAEANLVELAVRTGFSYMQLRSWVGESWLRVRFGADDYRRLVQASGVRTADQFRNVFGVLGVGAKMPATRTAVEIAEPGLAVKIDCVASLLRDWHPEGRHVRAPATPSWPDGSRQAQAGADVVLHRDA